MASTGALNVTEAAVAATPNMGWRPVRLPCLDGTNCMFDLTPISSPSNQDRLSSVLWALLYTSIENITSGYSTNPGVGHLPVPSSHTATLRAPLRTALLNPTRSCPKPMRSTLPRTLRRSEIAAAWSLGPQTPLASPTIGTLVSSQSGLS